MLINNKKLINFGAIKLKFEVDTSNYDNNGAFWNNGALKPIKGNKTETYRKLKIKLLFEGLDTDSIYKNISRFIEESKECIFKVDNLYYECELEVANTPQLINIKNNIVEIKYTLLDVYEDEKSITKNTNFTLDINSPKPCYANLELTSTTNVISYTVKVNDTEIVVKNIKGNETVYIGSGKVIAGGISKINDVDLWEFPQLKPGTNKIEVNRADVTLKIKYNERW